MKLGGEIVAEAEHEGRSGGSFIARKQEQVAKEPRSYTGGYLKELLAKSVRAEPVEALTSSKRKRVQRVREAAE